MKLRNVTTALALGALFAFGCSVENSPTTDGGTTDAAGDTAKADTGTTVTDTGTGGETATETGTEDCPTCQKNKCAAEQAACQKDMTTLKGCNDLIMCINACTDTACANKCVSDSMSTEGKALLQCVQEKCAAACAG